MKAAGLSQSKVTEAQAQESREAAARADAQNPDKAAAAGHTTTGQTPAEQAEGLREGGGAEARPQMEPAPPQEPSQALGGGA